jgi:hypothetical protein
MQDLVYKHQQRKYLLERSIPTDTFCKPVDIGRSNPSKFSPAAQLLADNFLGNVRCECAVREESLVPPLIFALYERAKQKVLALNRWYFGSVWDIDTRCVGLWLGLPAQGNVSRLEE